MTIFGNDSAKYKARTGKRNSLYIYVINRCPREELLDHISEQIKSLDRIDDAFRRKLYKSRYEIFRENITQRDATTTISNIFFIDDTLETHTVDKCWFRILEKYKCPKIKFTYGDVFDLEWLRDYVACDDPYHVICVTGNRFTHQIMTRTKKTTVDSREDKNLMLSDYILDQKLQKSKPYVLHGISSKFKGFSDPVACNCAGSNLSDPDIYSMIETIDNDEKICRLQEDLKLLIHEKTMHRVRFKKEIGQNIADGLLQRLYIDVDKMERFKTGCEQRGLDTNFEMVGIDSKLKSFIENTNPLNSYDGVVGITYY